MNARKVFLAVLAISLIGPSVGKAGQALGTAKARGDFGNYQTEGAVPRWAAQSRPTYRRSAPRYNDSVVPEVPSAAMAQAPAEERRYSQAPAAESTDPCPETTEGAAQPDSGRRYSYAPATQYSSNSVRRYSGNYGYSSRPNWSLSKTDPAKYNSR